MALFATDNHGRDLNNVKLSKDSDDRGRRIDLTDFGLPLLSETVDRSVQVQRTPIDKASEPFTVQETAASVHAASSGQISDGTSGSVLVQDPATSLSFDQAAAVITADNNANNNDASLDQQFVDVPAAPETASLLDTSVSTQDHAILDTIIASPAEQLVEPIPSAEETAPAPEIVIAGVDAPVAEPETAVLEAHTHVHPMETVPSDFSIVHKDSPSVPLVGDAHVLPVIGDVPEVAAIVPEVLPIIPVAEAPAVEPVVDTVVIDTASTNNSNNNNNNNNNNNSNNSNVNSS